MDYKSRYLKIFYIVIIIGFFFGVGWLLGKNKIGLFRYLPLTGSDNSIIIDNSQTITSRPWADNVDTRTNYYLPQIGELENIYHNFVQSISDRDYKSFSALASSKLLWQTDQNATILGKTTTGYDVWQTGTLTGDSYFEQYAPLLLYYQIPQIAKFFVAEGMQNVTLKADADYYYYNKNSGKMYDIFESGSTEALRVYFHIDYFYLEHANDHDGYVDFVFENNYWKILDQTWQTNFIKDTVIQAPTIQIRGNSAISEFDTTTDIKAMKLITINKGDLIRWDDINGMIFSLSSPTALTPWSSPLLNGSSFQISFNNSGEYMYTFVSNSNSQPLIGKIIIN